MTISQALLKLKTKLTKQGKSKSTIKSYLWLSRKFINTCNKPINQITNKDGTEFINHFQSLSSPISTSLNKSSNNHVANMNQNSYKRLATYAISSLFQNVLNKKFKHSSIQIRYNPKVLQDKEIRKIISKLNEPYKLIAKLAYYYCLRTNEILSLKNKDIKLKNLTITVKGRTVKFLGNENPHKLMHTSLSKQINKSKWLLPGRTTINHKTEKLRQNHINCTTLRKHLNQKSKTSHSAIRASRILHLYKQGYNAKEISKMLGQNYQNTRKYIKILLKSDGLLNKKPKEETKE